MCLVVVPNKYEDDCVYLNSENLESIGEYYFCYEFPNPQYLLFPFVDIFYTSNYSADCFLIAAINANVSSSNYPNVAC